MNREATHVILSGALGVAVISAFWALVPNLLPPSSDLMCLIHRVHT